LFCQFVPDLGDSVVMQINDTIKDISIVDVSSFNDLKSSLDLPNIDRDTAREVILLSYFDQVMLS
jgi:hypothetical protein